MHEGVFLAQTESQDGVAIVVVVHDQSTAPHSTGKHHHGQGGDGRGRLWAQVCAYV